MFASDLKLSNPKLPLLANRAKSVIDLALIKAVAHHRNPSQNPLPADPKSLERAYYNLFKAIPKRKQDDAIAKFQNLMTAAQRANAYGDLGQINFASAVSVVEQATALPLPANLRFNADDIADLQKQFEAGRGISGALKKAKERIEEMGGQAAKKPGNFRPPQQAVAAKQLEFEVVSATCVEPNDIRKDEINLAVTAIDGFGVGTSKGPFFVSKFKKGDDIALGDAGKIATFLISDVVFPASFPASAFMVESDWIHNNDLADKLIVAFLITGTAVSAVGMGFLVLGAASVVAIPIGLTGALVALIASLGFYSAAGVISLMADDISAPAAETLILDAAPVPGSVFERIITISFDSRGAYTVLLRWTAKE
jgi:hypothetical protein